MREVGIWTSDPLAQSTAALMSNSGQAIYPSTYNHTIDAVGGYKSCSFTFGADRQDMDDWLEHGAGRDVTVYDDALSGCWRGFVSKVSPVYGSLNVQVGPLLDAHNRVALQYSGVDLTVNPPAVGVQRTTTWADDTDSQDLYGIIPELLSTGGIDSATADFIRDSYLADNAYPPVRQDWTSRGKSKSALRVDCLGYVHWLMYPYNQTTNVGTLATNDKILAIIAANPNIAWLPFNTNYVDTPASPVQVPRYEFENILAWDQIKEIVAMGDQNAARWLFGVYDDLEVWYEQAPTDLGYYLSLADPAKRVVSNGQEVEYPAVKPGKWLLFTDFLAGAPTHDGDRSDPRTMFVESVTYTMPRTLVLRGGKTDTLSQTLARLGLGSL
jgi:hypothetical protein